jgi:uncharacterized protein
MTRDEALNLVTTTVTNRNLVKHMLAVEVCMRKLAEHFGEDVELWGLAGLLHDLDYDQTAKDFPRHGLLTAEMLAGKVDEKVIYAIKAHPGHVPAVSTMDKALYAVDPITGLIVASALMAPEKKLANVDRDFVLRRYKERKFAAGANREQIAACSQLGLTLEDFTQMCVEAMKGIASDLGL